MGQITKPDKPVLGRHLILLIIVGFCFLNIPESENHTSSGFLQSK